MAEIEIACSKCGYHTRVNVKTIDNLRAELKAMTDDRDYYRRKLAALECMNKTKPSDDLFSKLFR
jgi:ribosomal protein L44E